jgi:hypothetical protein
MPCCASPCTSGTALNIYACSLTRGRSILRLTDLLRAWCLSAHLGAWRLSDRLCGVATRGCASAAWTCTRNILRLTTYLRA